MNSQMKSVCFIHYFVLVFLHKIRNAVLKSLCGVDLHAQNFAAYFIICVSVL